MGDKSPESVCLYVRLSICLFVHLNFPYSVALPVKVEKFAKNWPHRDTEIGAKSHYNDCAEAVDQLLIPVIHRLPLRSFRFLDIFRISIVKGVGCLNWRMIPTLYVIQNVQAGRLVYISLFMSDQRKLAASDELICLPYMLKLQVIIHCYQGRSKAGKIIRLIMEW